jgi:SAM-dependent methyltransferase
MAENKGRCVQVRPERWQEAQAWEREQWIHTERMRAKFGKNYLWRLLAWLKIKPPHRGDDSNGWWRNQFENYDFVPKHLGNAVELGCGPYTNMRLILEGRSCHHLALSDPLIRTYVHFPLAFIGDLYRRGFCLLDDHPIEACPFASDYFDLVVMTNVLDHVQDAARCMAQAVRITRPGGLLIIGQDLSNEEDAQRMQNDPGQIGHPIRVDHTWMDTHLTGFSPVLKRVLPREAGRAPEHHYGTYVFAGQKNGEQGASQ